MKSLTIVPIGWACHLDDCEPGHFFFMSNGETCLGFKDEYGKEYNEAGEYYCGQRESVQPATLVWVDN